MREQIRLTRSKKERYLSQETRDQIQAAWETQLPTHEPPTFVYYVDYSLNHQTPDELTVLQTLFPPYEMFWWHQIGAFHDGERYLWMKQEQYWISPDDFRKLLIQSE